MREMVGTKPFTTSNNRKAMKGKCKVCGTQIIRFIKGK
jgi:hypothetical protein